MKTLLIFALLNIGVEDLLPEPKSSRASWYGKQFHGRKTASGEIFDTTLYTCASPTLKFGTEVRIKNKANGKTVQVRVNDRGPYDPKSVGGKLRPHPTRSFDLSTAAFQQLADIRDGEIKVEYTILK